MPLMSEITQKMVKKFNLYDVYKFVDPFPWQPFQINALLRSLESLF